MSKHLPLWLFPHTFIVIFGKFVVIITQGLIWYGLEELWFPLAFRNLICCYSLIYKFILFLFLFRLWCPLVFIQYIVYIVPPLLSGRPDILIQRPRNLPDLPFIRGGTHCLKTEWMRVTWTGPRGRTANIRSHTDLDMLVCPNPGAEKILIIEALSGQTQGKIRFRSLLMHFAGWREQRESVRGKRLTSFANQIIREVFAGFRDRVN